MLGEMRNLLKQAGITPDKGSGATVEPPIKRDDVKQIVNDYLNSGTVTREPKVESGVTTEDGRPLVPAPDGTWIVQQEEKKDKTLKERISDALTVNMKGGGKLQIYGFPRGDIYFGSGKFFPSLEVPFFALPEDPRFTTGPVGSTFFPSVPGVPGVPVHDDDSTFTGNARLTRIGLLHTGNKAKWLWDADLEGRIEMDFYNTLENPIASRALPRIRHGYGKATWGGFSILVGQYWDIISPLYPTINDDLLMWNAGNTGDRRPQVRFNWDIDCGYDRHVILTTGITATDAVDRSDFGGDGFFDGEDTGAPGFQGRLAVKTPSWCDGKSSEVGVWGLVSGDATNVPIGLSRRSHFTSWIVGADWDVPLLPKVALRGEAWYGSNLDDYRGGIDQGINGVLGREIDAWGGWTELVVKPRDWYQLAAGVTVDDPRNGDVLGSAFGRTQNVVYYLGNRFPVGGGLTFAFDFEFWRTDFLGFDHGDAQRIKFWLMQVF